MQRLFKIIGYAFMAVAGFVILFVGYLFVAPMIFPPPEPDIPATDAEEVTPVAMMGG